MVLNPNSAALPAEQTTTNYLSKTLYLLALLYIFILAITLLSGSFKLMGRDVADAILQISHNPLVSLFIGILATSIIQSSSTATSIVVGLVGAAMLPMESAVPMIMGANIGTSVTNTIVSLAHINSGPEFRRAFAGSIVHDFFNILSVIVLFPLEVAFSIISKPATWIVEQLGTFGGSDFHSPIAIITKPVAKWIMHALGDNGALSAALALLLLFFGLRFLVKVLKTLVLSKVERFFQTYIFRQPILGFVLGIGLTILVQSSSITTSLIIPLIGAGVVTIRQVFPYFLGANIGTTATAFIASFTLNSPAAVVIAVSHLMFNVFGGLMFWPLRRIPIYLAERMADLTQHSRFFALAYILLVFFIIPGIVIYFAV